VRAKWVPETTERHHRGRSCSDPTTASDASTVPALDLRPLGDLCGRHAECTELLDNTELLAIGKCGSVSVLCVLSEDAFGLRQCPVTHQPFLDVRSRVMPSSASRRSISTRKS
jgi:hypothetical protein